MHSSEDVELGTFSKVFQNLLSLLYLQSLKADRLPVKQAFLFGSYAHGRPRPHSDVDLCIVSSRFSDPVSAIQYLLSKRKLDLRYPIEPIGFHPRDFNSDMPITREIKKYGIRIL